MPFIDYARPSRTCMKLAAAFFLVACVLAVLGVLLPRDRPVEWVAASVAAVAIIFLGQAVPWSRGRGDWSRLRRAEADHAAREALDPRFENNPRQPSRRFRSWRDR